MKTAGMRRRASHGEGTLSAWRRAAARPARRAVSTRRVCSPRAPRRRTRATRVSPRPRARSCTMSLGRARVRMPRRATRARSSRRPAPVAPKAAATAPSLPTRHGCPHLPAPVPPSLRCGYRPAGAPGALSSHVAPPRSPRSPRSPRAPRRRRAGCFAVGRRRPRLC